jgi:hypothetical protein
MEFDIKYTYLGLTPRREYRYIDTRKVTKLNKRLVHEGLHDANWIKIKNFWSNKHLGSVYYY